MIEEKLFKIMEAIDHVDTSKMEFGRTKYNYISEQEVTTRLREEMIKNKVVVFPTSVMYSTQTLRDNTLTDVSVMYRFVDVEDGSYVDVAGGGQGYDQADKAFSKAMTAAFKVMQRQTFAIPSPSKDDPDTFASESYSNKSASTTPAVEPPKDPESIEIHFGTHKGKTLKELSSTKTGRSYIEWLATKYTGTGALKEAAQILNDRFQQDEPA